MARASKYVKKILDYYGRGRHRYFYSTSAVKKHTTKKITRAAETKKIREKLESMERRRNPGRHYSKPGFSPAEQGERAARYDAGRARRR